MVGADNKTNEIMNALKQQHSIADEMKGHYLHDWRFSRLYLTLYIMAKENISEYPFSHLTKDIDYLTRYMVDNFLSVLRSHGIVKLSRRGKQNRLWLLINKNNFLDEQIDQALKSLKRKQNDDRDKNG